MKRYIKDNSIYITEYNSLSEFITEINSLPNNRFYPNDHSSERKEREGGDFYGTTDYKQATEMLTHGWDAAAKKLAEKVKPTNTIQAVARSSKPVFGVVGSQASIPRYLQGIPTNMASRQTIYTKQKIVTITKGISYSARWTTNQILEECIKALQIIQSLENGGHRVRLNVMLVTTCDDHPTKHNACKVCIKQPDERLNISKMSFALAHPSMLRRFFFKWIETDPFAEYYPGWGFGFPSDISIKNKAMEANEYYLPEQINDIDALVAEFSKPKR